MPKYWTIKEIADELNTTKTRIRRVMNTLDVTGIQLERIPERFRNDYQNRTRMHSDTLFLTDQQKERIREYIADADGLPNSNIEPERYQNAYQNEAETISTQSTATVAELKTQVEALKELLETEKNHRVEITSLLNARIEGLKQLSDRHTQIIAQQNNMLSQRDARIAELESLPSKTVDQTRQTDAKSRAAAAEEKDEKAQEQLRVQMDRVANAEGALHYAQEQLDAAEQAQAAAESRAADVQAQIDAERQKSTELEELLAQQKKDAEIAAQGAQTAISDASSRADNAEQLIDDVSEMSIWSFLKWRRNRKRASVQVLPGSSNDD